jgi:hypothetical protein
VPGGTGSLSGLRSDVSSLPGHGDAIARWIKRTRVARVRVDGTRVP